MLREPYTSTLDLLHGAHFILTFEADSAFDHSEQVLYTVQPSTYTQGFRGYLGGEYNGNLGDRGIIFPPYGGHGKTLWDCRCTL